VVDAGSKDNTCSIAEKSNLPETKVKVIKSTKKNVSFQRNLGAKYSNSGWIVFMDADNRVPKTYLQKVKRHIEAKNPDIVSTWMKPDSRLRKDRITAAIMNIFMEINKKSKKPYVLESMIFIKKDSFQKIKGFNINIPWREGEDLLNNAIKHGIKFDFIKTPRYTYSFRRLEKIGTYKMLQEMAQMEIVIFLKGKLPKSYAKKLYPMKGGGLYLEGKDTSLTLQNFISMLFEDSKISKKTVSLFKESLNSWKSFFR
jgi:glycosyltransferase involved in cell wall biosynthesis